MNRIALHKFSTDRSPKQSIAALLDFAILPCNYTQNRRSLFVDRPPAGAGFPNAPTLKKGDRTRRDRSRRPSIAQPVLIYFAYRND